MLRRSSVSYNFARKQIKYDAGVKVDVLDFKTGCVADPNAVWLFDVKLLLQYVLAFGAVELFLIIAFRVSADALQIHFAH